MLGARLWFAGGGRKPTVVLFHATSDRRRAARHRWTEIRSLVYASPMLSNPMVAEKSLLAETGTVPPEEFCLGHLPGGPSWFSGPELLAVEGRRFRGLISFLDQERAFDRKGVAAAFLLRFAQVCRPALLGALHLRPCPDLTLQNTAYRFSKDVFVEQVAVKAVAGGPKARSLSAALGQARAALFAQHSPLVDALSGWSQTRPHVLWGQVTSAWAQQWLSLECEVGGVARAVDLARCFLAGGDAIAEASPRFVCVSEVHSRYQLQRASCCRYYLSPQGAYCQSCPLPQHRPAGRRPERRGTWAGPPSAG